MMDAEKLLEVFNTACHRDREHTTADEVRQSGLRAVAEAAWDEGKAMGIVMLTARPGTYDSAILDNPYREGTP